MNKRKEIQLLEDITKLLNKHGLESFESLALLLSDKDFTQTLVNILQQVSNTSKSLKKKTKKTSGTKQDKTLRSSIAELKESDSERGMLLLNLYDKLYANELLPRLSQIRAFAQDNNLEPITARSRKNAISQFIRAIWRMPVKDLNSLVMLVEEKGKPENDRTLDAWSSVILDDKTNK